MKILGATVACIFAVAIPFWYYFQSVTEIRNTQSIENIFLAKSVEKAIHTRPDLWEFDIAKLQEIVSQDVLHGQPCERIIRNAAGVVVVKTDATARYPVNAASVTLFDSGRPVGSIETRHSVRTPVIFTVLLGIFSSLLGALIYFILRIYPIRKLDSTLAELQRAEEEQRLSRETAERLAEETAVIAEIGRLIGSTLDIKEVYERFAAEAGKLIPFDRIAVNLCSISENTLTVAYVSGADIPYRNQGDSSPLTGTLSAEILRRRTGMVIQNTNVDEIVSRFPALSPNLRAGLLSFLSVPLISRNHVIAVLHFRSKKTDAYTEHHLRIAERIGAQIAGAIANAQLFADLRRAEGSLRESEERSRALVEQAAVGVAEIDIHTSRFIRVNHRLCEMVGRTEEEMLATTFHAITHPEDAPMDEENRALLLAGKIRQYNREKRYLRKDGGIVWVNITISPLWMRGEKSGRNMIVVEDITERKRMEAEMREMSLRDLLTELYNRRGFITLAEQQIKAANRAKRPLQLTFIDLDRLKWINDTLGHEQGDRVLIDTAHLLRQTFRESDIIARLGGDEFAVLSIDSGDVHHGNVSQRLQQHIDAYNSEESRLYKLSMSWGTVTYNPDSPVSLDQLLSAADELMYTQKRAKSHRGD